MGPKKGTEKAAKAAAKPAEPKVDHRGEKDKAGIPVTSDGVTDKRFKYKPGEAPTKTQGQKPGITRQETMTKLLGDKPYTFVREGFDADGVKSVTGAKLKRFFVIKGKSGEEVTVGKGEMEKYADLKPPSKRGKKAEVEADNAEAFEGEETTAEATEGEETAEPAADFIED